MYHVQLLAPFSEDQIAKLIQVLDLRRGGVLADAREIKLGLRSMPECQACLARPGSFLGALVIDAPESSDWGGLPGKSRVFFYLTCDDCLASRGEEDLSAVGLRVEERLRSLLEQEIDHLAEAPGGGD